MIELVGKPGDENPKIRFRPRPGFKRKFEVREFDLVYGHYCPQCMNVVQALFLTPEPVDLWPYEETNIMSTGKSEEKYGSVLKVVPNAQSDPGYSNYTSTFRPAVSGERAQHLVLINHVLKYHGLARTDYDEGKFLERGIERPCEYAGVFSLRADLIVRDICGFMRMTPGVIAAYNLPPVEQFLDKAVADGFRSLPAYGSAPPVVLFPIEWVKAYGSREWPMRTLLDPWEKPKEKAVKAPF